MSTEGDDRPALPGWAGLSTLFGTPTVELSALPRDGVDAIAAGVPFDATATSRPGAAEGPEAIRRASRVYAESAKALGDAEMIDMRTGSTFRYRRPRLVEAGDVAVYPTDPERHFASVSASAAAIAATGAMSVFLGGDHSVSYPLFAGVARAWAERDPGARLAYVQVDHHFDFGDRSLVYGSLYHGSNARRISELPHVALDRLAFIGVGDATRREQLQSLQRAGSHVVSAAALRATGPRRALEPLAEAFDGATALYVSVDIDVLDAAQAPGTGNVTGGGLTVPELHDVLDVLKRFRIVAIDVVEVAPRYDPTGRTAQIAARLLFEFLYRQAV
ncbi:MAG TPA: arginase family protein [Actinomycetota bacterium]|nr:arginase family protein [Actinomycetota bacterium]